MSQDQDHLLLDEGPASLSGLTEPASIPIDAGAQEVTMSGDLQKIELSDIFQTLAMSKMVGVLKLSHPLEQRMLFFEDGFVKDFGSGRNENRRLGQRLIRAGLVSPDEVRHALDLQRQNPRPLGQILVEEGVIDEGAIEDVAYYQAAEDLYSLFTWQQGAFEFYRGAPQFEGAERLERLPRFEVNGVLLEVARRSDEWDLINAQLHSVDEIFLPIEESDTGELSGDHLTVLHALDGTRSVRELPDHTVLGLFDCARTLKDLNEWNLVELARPDELLAVAEMQRLRNDTRRAVVTLRTLVDRGEKLDLVTTRELAAAMERCAEPRMAAQTLWRKSADTQDEDPDEALELAREACRLDKRSTDILQYLLDMLLARNVEGDEPRQVTADLIEALLQEGKEERALRAVEQLENLGGDPVAILSRKAKLLQKLDRIPEAVIELTRLTEFLKQDKRREELIKVYEQIMMLDSRRRDIAKALVTLRSSARARKMRVGAIITVVAGTLFAGHSLLSGTLFERDFQGVLATLREQLDRSLTDGLPQLIANARAEFGDRPELLALERDVLAQQQRQSSDVRSSREGAIRRDLGVAANHLARGDVEAAVLLYRELLLNTEFEQLVRDASNGRLSRLPQQIEILAKSLPEQVPPPAQSTDSPERRRLVLRQIDERFQDMDRAIAQGALAAAEGALLSEWLTEGQRLALLQDCRTVLRAFDAAGNVRSTYETALSQAAVEERLQPVFLAAREHEANYDFAAALEAYRTLAREYPKNNELKQTFVRRVQRYEAILTQLRAIQAATEAGAHAQAVSGLTDLAQMEPTLPVQRLVRLPLRVETTPAGATVSINGTTIGQTPVLGSYVPDGETVVSIDRDGFQPEEVRFEGGDTARVALALAKVADWSTEMAGAVERAPVCDGRGRAYVVDRAGTVAAIDLASGVVAWKFPTGDPNGLLPSPALCGDQIAVASFDGRLRWFDARTGRLAHQVENLPCEAAPVKVGSTLLVATHHGALVGFNRGGGQAWIEGFRLDLGAGVEFDIAAVNGHAVVATRDGALHCVRVRDGRVIWRSPTSSRVAAAPHTDGHLIASVCDDGALEVRTLRSGDVVWQRRGLGELALTPVVAGDRVLVASDRNLLALAARDGEPIAFQPSEPLYCSPPAVGPGGVVLVGDRSGVVRVLDGATLQVQYLLRSDSRLLAPVAADAGGRLVLAFESGKVQGYTALSQNGR